MRADFKAKNKAPLVIDLKMITPVAKTVRLIGTGPIDQTATVKVPNLNTDDRTFTFSIGDEPELDQLSISKPYKAMSAVAGPAQRSAKCGFAGLEKPFQLLCRP